MGEGVGGGTERGRVSDQISQNEMNLNLGNQATPSAAGPSAGVSNVVESHLASTEVAADPASSRNPLLDLGPQAPTAGKPSGWFVRWKDYPGAPSDLSLYDCPQLSTSTSDRRVWFPLTQHSKPPDSFLAKIEALGKDYQPEAEFYDALVDNHSKLVFFPGQRLIFSEAQSEEEEFYVGAIRLLGSNHYLLRWYEDATTGSRWLRLGTGKTFKFDPGFPSIDEDLRPRFESEVQKFLSTSSVRSLPRPDVDSANMLQQRLRPVRVREVVNSSQTVPSAPPPPTIQKKGKSAPDGAVPTTSQGARGPAHVAARGHRNASPPESLNLTSIRLSIRRPGWPAA